MPSSVRIAPRHRPSLLGLLVLALALAACDEQTVIIVDAPPLPPDPTVDLGAARARWSSEARTDYAYDFRWLCFCPPDFVRSVRVRVEGGTVTRVTDLETGVDLPSARLSDWKTAEELFDLVQDAIARDAEMIRVEYDPDTGLPLDFWADYELGVADEELGFEAGRYRVDGRPGS